MFGDDVNELMMILKDVYSARGVADRWCWSIDPLNSFSVRSCYLFLSQADQASPVDSSRPVSAWQKSKLKALWRTHIPTKILLFGWRIFNNSLHVRSVLLKRHVIHSEEDAACVLCRTHIEDSHHLFLGCEFSLMVWGEIGRWLNVRVPCPSTFVDHFLNYSEICYGKKAKRIKHIFWLTTCWCLWLSRNSVCFRG